MTDGSAHRPGCLAGQILGMVARLALVYPPVGIGSQLGQAAQRALWQRAGTPYEGALVGIIVGLLIGLSLWRSALRSDDWHARLADATLATVALLWLAALFVVATTPTASSDLVVPGAVCLAGSAGIAALLRA